MGPTRGRRSRPGGDVERSAEPVPLADVVAGLAEDRAFAAGMAVGRLAREWEGVVGDRLARESAPRRLEGGTLVVQVSTGPWGAQVGFLAEEIRIRANQTLGSGAIRRVEVVVVEKEPKSL